MGWREFVPAARTVLIIAEAGARLADIAAHLGGRELTRLDAGRIGRGDRDPGPLRRA
jgi:hypothetical protein